MIIYALPMAVGFGLFVVAHATEEVLPIYFGRFLTGFAAGAFSFLSPMYIVECSESSMRGALASLMQLQVTIGAAFVNVLNINGAISWEIISAVMIAFPVLLAIGMFFMPESPVYLVSKGKIEQAEASLKWLRGQDYDVSQELRDLQEEAENQRQIGSITFTELFTKRVYVMPMLISAALMFFQQFSGINVVIFYTQKIFNDAGSDLDIGLSAFLVTLAQVIGTALAVLVVERFGRKILLFLSDFLMCIFIIALGVYFYIDDHADVEICPEPIEGVEVRIHFFKPASAIKVRKNHIISDDNLFHQKRRF
jgi:MFS family permease